MKRKVLAVILCLAVILSVTLPGTLALSTAQDSTSSDISVGSTETTEGATETTTATTEPGETAPATTGETEGNNDASTETTQPGEAAGQSLPEVPQVEEKKNHNLETCTEDCSDENCTCICHLVAKLLATETVEDFFNLAEAMTDEQFDAMSQEQIALIDAHLAAIEPQPAPAIVLEESEPPVESEVYIPTKNFTNVAPFGDPVTGK